MGGGCGSTAMTTVLTKPTFQKGDEWCITTISSGGCADGKPSDRCYKTKEDALYWECDVKQRHSGCGAEYKKTTLYKQQNKKLNLMDLEMSPLEEQAYTVVLLI